VTLAGTNMASKSKPMQGKAKSSTQQAITSFLVKAGEKQPVITKVRFSILKFYLDVEHMDSH
jgi:hypothetical protein